MHHAAYSTGPAFCSRKSFLVPFVGESQVDVLVEKGELGIAGVVANPFNRPITCECIEVVIGQLADQSCSACIMRQSDRGCLHAVANNEPAPPFLLGQSVINIPLHKSAKKLTQCEQSRDQSRRLQSPCC